MKLHKIPGIPLDVCAAEQKIAYNLAFRIHVNRGDEYLAIPDSRKAQAVEWLVEEALGDYRNAYAYKPGKYDEEAIAVFLKNGLANYLDQHFIATNYERVGKAFPTNS